MEAACALALVLTAAPAAASAPVSHAVEDDFDAVAFAVESANPDRGLVIDHVSDVGEMV
jgi:hypothetical protein